MKCVFAIPLRGLQGLIDSVFKFVQLPLLCLHYSCYA
ncbi:transposase [Candidatus Enterovibrio altilux]